MFPNSPPYQKTAHFNQSQVGIEQQIKTLKNVNCLRLAKTFGKTFQGFKLSSREEEKDGKKGNGKH